jgi:large subunit ribosomal protein L10e
MVRKPARMYRQITGPAYTRRKFMGGVPQPKITIFEHGLKKPHSHKVFLISEENVQVTHSALESARVTANKYLVEACGAQNYYMRVRPYPHQVLREHRQAVGAGADRVSQGMRHAFGVAVGTAARVYRGQIVLEAGVDEDKVPAAKAAFKRARIRLPLKSSRIVVQKADGS